MGHAKDRGGQGDRDDKITNGAGGSDDIIEVVLPELLMGPDPHTIIFVIIPI